MEIRVVVIDDSAFMRKMISEMLESDSRIKVVATARSGRDGIEKIKKYQPHVATLDVEMPVMDGIEALEEIMDSNPLPIIMLSSVTTAGAAMTMRAVQLGAIDFIAKPSGPISLDIDEIKDELIKKVIAASNALVMKKEANVKEIEKQEKPLRAAHFHQPHARSVVAIGTSTGGPKALLHVLKGIPADFPAPIVIVQHMPPGFTKSLAERLDHSTSIHVKEAEHGEILQNGHAYIAPGDYHLEIKQVGTALVNNLNHDNKINGHRPSVDVLFESLVNIGNVNKLAVILTGMGNDGSKGIRSMKRTDPKTIVIAEDKETSVVYGMPKAAVLTNCVDHVAKLQQISEIISGVLRKKRGI
ncbi:chemotaxis response regulator protein-glutamate methylesterase [Aciduricibacillus chroicocephali]|uniref:Protein-glutamate methylesterase/protein-glutamine glutaminase n=1 Tax=Aciduricibacillus chroicocephali TaxID=3054939 RepID=A0ABY9KYM7_9BACI|nr:chemotaxis response regulator protein-glutamate methylesterase [Bacillaceae bacterium 44XB]